LKIRYILLHCDHCDLELKHSYLQAQDSLGVAQTFNIVSALVEAIGVMVENRVAKRKEEAEEKYRKESEVASQMKPCCNLITGNAAFLGGTGANSWHTCNT